jgi:hypothetical protein
MKLHLEPVIPDYSNEPQQWYALVESDEGSPMYDAVGPTVELALAGLVKELCRVMEDDG